MGGSLLLPCDYGVLRLVRSFNELLQYELQLDLSQQVERSQPTRILAVGSALACDHEFQILVVLLDLLQGLIDTEVVNGMLVMLS